MYFFEKQCFFLPLLFSFLTWNIAPLFADSLPTFPLLPTLPQSSFDIRDQSLPYLPPEEETKHTEFTTNKVYETPLSTEKETKNEAPKKLATVEAYIEDMLLRFPEKTKEEFMHYIGSCFNFEQNISICEPSTCIMGHPIFTFYDPEIKVTKIIDGKIDGKCHYTEYLPQNAYRQCSLSEKGQAIFSKIHHHWLYELAPEFSLKTTDYVDYTNIVTQECSLHYDPNDEIFDDVLSSTKKGKSSFLLPKVSQGKSYSAIRKKEESPYIPPNYHNYLLPGPIAFKHYTKENNHLPPVMTLNDYHRAFFNAAKEGNIDGIYAFLKQGLDVNIKDAEGNTALIHAVFYNHETALRFLLRHNADATLKNNEGKTALHVGASRASPSLLAVLLFYKCDPEAKDNEGKIAIDYSVSQEDLTNLEFLLTQPHANLTEKALLEKAFFSSIKNGTITSFNKLLEKKVSIESRDENGKTPLMVAAAFGQSLMVDVLLSKNAKYNARDPHGHDAWYFASSSGNEDISNILLTCKIQDELKNLPIKTLTLEKKNTL